MQFIHHKNVDYIVVQCKVLLHCTTQSTTERDFTYIFDRAIWGGGDGTFVILKYFMFDLNTFCYKFILVITITSWVNV